MKIKRLASLAAASLLVVQMLGVGIASATVLSTCDFGSDDLEISIADTDVDLWIEGAKLYCSFDADSAGDFDNTDDADFIVLRALESVTVEMEDETSAGQLSISLEDEYDDDGVGPDPTTGEAADWPAIKTFDLDVSTRVYIDASDVTADGYNAVITIGAKSISFNGATVTASVRAYEIDGTDGRDTIDGSKTAARLDIEGGNGNDLIKGGSARDILDGEADVDTIYGNAGDDDLYGGNSDGDACWGGDGNDYLDSCKTVAPGAGDDEIVSIGEAASSSDSDNQRVTYADLTGDVVWEQDDCDGSVYTGGAAGDDVFSDGVERVTTGSGNDEVTEYCASVVSTGAGNDLVRAGLDTSGTGVYSGRATARTGVNVFGGDGDDRISSWDYADAVDYFYGGAGNDTLRGGYNTDTLVGGQGKDKLYGGAGKDVCRGGEIVKACGGTPA